MWAKAVQEEAVRSLLLAERVVPPTVVADAGASAHKGGTRLRAASPVGVERPVVPNVVRQPVVVLDEASPFGRLRL